jgi:hypothetical protein
MGRQTTGIDPYRCSRRLLGYWEKVLLDWEGYGRGKEKLGWPWFVAVT